MGLISLLIVGERRKIRQRQARRRTVRKVCRERIPQHIKSVVWRRDGGQCVRCGSTDRLEFGHIIPWSKADQTQPTTCRCCACPATDEKGTGSEEVAAPAGNAGRDGAEAGSGAGASRISARATHPNSRQLM